jgi:hypothetical protein
MPTFYFEKLVSVLLPIFVVLALILLIFYRFSTEVLVPPADQATFVQELVKVSEKKQAENTVSLMTPHRSESDIKTYLTRISSDILSFDKQSFSDVMKNIRPYFTDAAFSQYNQYLLDSGIAETVRTEDIKVSSYVDTPPFFVNSSVINNTYKWLYDIPIVISYIPLGHNMAEKSEDLVSTEVYLRLQITRVIDPDDKINGMKIEDWQVMGR